MTRSGWWLLGGLAAVSIGGQLPFDSLDGYTGPSNSGAGVVFIILALGALVVGAPLLTRTLSKRRLLGVSAPVALLAVYAVTNWSALSHLRNQSGGLVSVAPGSGLMLYTVGVVVLCVLVVRLWLVRRRTVASA